MPPSKIKRTIDDSPGKVYYFSKGSGELFKCILKIHSH